MFLVRDREAGNEICLLATEKEAIKMIEKFEKEDKQEGTYTPNFYEVVEFTIRTARESKGMTQVECSEWLQMPKRTLENWEQGSRSCPAYIERLIIAEILRYK